jgi:hypothetical protein
MGASWIELFIHRIITVGTEFRGFGCTDLVKLLGVVDDPV